MRLHIRLVAFGLCILSTSAYASIDHYSRNETTLSNQTISQENKQNSELLNYLSNTLSEAGVPDNARKYLVDISRTQLSNINIRNLSFKEKKALLKVNLYILLNNLAEEIHPAFEDMYGQYVLASRHEHPSDFLFTSDQLHHLNSENVFNTITLKDVKKATAKFCPAWPFCRGSHEHKRK